MIFGDIRLLVNDFDKCFDFYKNKLNLEPTWGDFGETYASFNLGYSNVISLFKADLMMEAIGERLTESDQHIKKFVIVIRVENLDEKYNELLSNGIEFINEPTEKPGWGDYVVHLKDPEGNLIEICSDLESSKWDKDLLDAKEKYTK